MILCFENLDVYFDAHFAVEIEMKYAMLTPVRVPKKSPFALGSSIHLLFRLQGSRTQTLIFAAFVRGSPLVIGYFSHIQLQQTFVCVEALHAITSPNLG